MLNMVGFGYKAHVVIKHILMLSIHQMLNTYMYISYGIKGATCVYLKRGCNNWKMDNKVNITNNNRFMFEEVHN